MSSDSSSTAGVPLGLVGDWSQGSVPMTTDPTNWFATTGSGFLYRFQPDGTYEFSGSMTGVGMTISSYERGTYAVDADVLTLTPTEEQVRQPDGSVSTSRPEPRSFRWQIGVDPIGSVILVLGFPDGQQEVFYRG
jgi:hypothetical protein